ncbi:TPA: hypothetical protein ACH3X1_006169 [Trebouxia sp. C0004]
MPKSLADSSFNKPSCSNHSRYPKQACKLERPSNFQMHNNEGCQLKSTQRGHHGSPKACLNLKYASMSSPIMPSTRNGEDNREPVHVTQQPPSNSKRVGSCLSHMLKTPSKSRLRVVARSNM